jgi:pimeloyl-ACP methyl ester carboxylesterase
MKKHILLLVLVLASISSSAQFAVGHTTITFGDPNRTGGFGSGGGPGRQIQTEIYYPATTAGTNVPMAISDAPLIVFGHGFVMTWTAYQPFYDHWASLGYVVALPRTEGGLLPNHQDFAEDLAFVAHEIQSLGNNSSSIFHQNLNQRIAIAGHSMGGGAAILSHTYQIIGVSCFLTFAAAETTPSAILAATSCTIPSFFVSGSYDCVVPTATQIQMYDSMASTCKTHIEFTDAYHCQFNTYNLNCATGEASCFTPGGIVRDTQINRTLAYADDYLDFYLKENCESWNSFKSKYDLNYGMLTSKKTNCSYSIPTNPTLSFDGTNLITNGAGFSLYIWKRNGTIILTSGASSFAPTQNGSYTVCAYTPFGCYLESTPYLLNTLSVPNIEKGNLLQLDILNKKINITASENSTLKILSVNGQVIQQYKNQKTVDYHQLANGIYILELNHHKGIHRQLLQVW